MQLERYTHLPSLAEHLGIRADKYGYYSFSDTILDGFNFAMSLQNTNFRGAELHNCKFSSSVRNCDFSKAKLEYCDFEGVDLQGTNFSGARLYHVRLDDTKLEGSIFTHATLLGTILDPSIMIGMRDFVKSVPIVNRHGGRIVWRTGRSRFVGSTTYYAGRTYTAPVLSQQMNKACHPGIYAGELGLLLSDYVRPDSLVKCYVRDGDWIYCSKGYIRCKRIRVLEMFVRKYDYGPCVIRYRSLSTDKAFTVRELMEMKK